MNPNLLPDSKLDDATQRRLRQLAAAPVDSSRLQRMLEASLATAATAALAGPEVQSDTAPSRRASVFRRWTRPIVSLAASLALAAVIIAGLLLSGQNPVVASPIELSALHTQIVTGQRPVTQVTTIDDARDAIARQWSQGPGLPDLEGVNVQSCCLAHVHGKLVAAVLLDFHGQPVTLIVADAHDFVAPHGRTYNRGGRTIVAHEAQGLNMAMTRQGDRWLCVMGHVAEDQLVALAAAAF